MRRLPFPLLPKLARWLGVAAVVAVIGYFSLIAPPPDPPTGPVSLWDKRLHFVAYLGLSLAIAYATADGSLGGPRRLLVVLGVAVLLGVGIELVQGVLPPRYFGLLDLVANVIGALLGSAWLLAERRLDYRGFLSSNVD